jgi:hypothetical protein
VEHLGEVREEDGGGAAAARVGGVVQVEEEGRLELVVHDALHEVVE